MEMYISESAVEELLDNHKYFLNRAYQLCRDWGTAEDVVQEAYIKVIRFARNEKGLKKYMDRTMYSVFIDMKREEKRKPVLKECDFGDDQTLDLIPAKEPDPYDNEITGLVARALKCVPKQQRDVFVDYALGQKYEEISKARQIPRGTVGSRVHRAQRTLKEVLQKTGL